MPKFTYVATNLDGKELKGKLSAQDKNDAVAQLRRQELTVKSITQEVEGGFLASLLGKGKKKAPRPHVKADDLVVFTRQMATMISAGIPLLEALEIMRDQVEDPGFGHVLAEVVDSIRSGVDLSQSLRQHPKVFEDIYVNMIKAGEVSGQLDEILIRLAEYQEASLALRREIKSAMTYPVMSLCMIFGITGFLMIGIVPKFKAIFDSMEIDLPGITKLLLAVSLGLKNNWWQGLLGIIAFFVVFSFYKKSKMGREQLDWLMLKMPIFGPLFRKVAISRFAKTFATLIQSGVPILGALEIVASTAGNTVIEKVIRAAQESVRQGETLSTPLSKSDVFPPMVTRMISVGERSGALEALLEKISEFYDQQVSATVEALTSLIEPLMIGIMGMVVGGIVLAVFLPIFKLQSQLSGGG